MSIRANLGAGDLDQRIRIEGSTITQDAGGDLTTTWAEKITCWAKVDGEKANSERFVSNGIRSAADMTMWIRADIFTRFALVLTDRVVWKGRVYDIVDIPDQQLRGRFIAMFVRTGLNQG